MERVEVDHLDAPESSLDVKRHNGVTPEREREHRNNILFYTTERSLHLIGGFEYNLIQRAFYRLPDLWIR